MKLYQPNDETGYAGDPFMSNLLTELWTEKAGIDMTDYVSLNQYKSTISDKSVPSLVKEVLDKKENKGATEQEALQLLIDNGIIVKNQ